MDEVKAFLDQFGEKLAQVIQKPRRLYFYVPNEEITTMAEYLHKKLGCRLSTATAQETYDGIEITYHFSLDRIGQYFCPRVLLDKKQPRVQSITPIVYGAIWIEREIFDFWGVEFVGHPRMERLLALHHPQNLDKPLRFGRQA
jgi:NADH-quinone oxidoreductase subunit C